MRNTTNFVKNKKSHFSIKCERFCENSKEKLNKHKKSFLMIYNLCGESISNSAQKTLKHSKLWKIDVFWHAGSRIMLGNHQKHFFSKNFICNENSALFWVYYPILKCFWQIFWDYEVKQKSATKSSFSHFFSCMPQKNQFF